MADDDQDESKTEEPSERKLKKAREGGQIAFSKEIGSALNILGITILFFFLGGWLYESIANLISHIFSNIKGWDYDVVPFGSVFLPVLSPIVKILSIIMAVAFLFPLIGHILQKGIDPKYEAAKPKLDKLNPVSGIKQFFSLELIVNFVKNLLKTIGLVLIFYLTIEPYIDKIIHIAAIPFSDALSLVFTIFIKFFLTAVLFLVVVAGLDYYVSYRRTRQKLMMSRQELKDEMKDTEGNPEIKGKVKQIQRERSKRQIDQEVPDATVVVTNPTHYAVALKYEKGVVPVPKVVAKGVDSLALKIREVAKENKVPVIENPPLARSLYREVKAGREIPYKFYKAVAKLIGTILRLEAEKKRRKEEARNKSRPNPYQRL